MLHSSISVLVIKLWLTHPSVPALLQYLGIAFGIIASADVLRFRSPAFERTYEKYLGLFMVSVFMQSSLARARFQLGGRASADALGDFHSENPREVGRAERPCIALTNDDWTELSRCCRRNKRHNLLPRWRAHLLDVLPTR